MNRLGLVDFWYYDYQEFYFNNGHMMLRGGNGSGKSVTMQSFLPLILDGNKSSSRLDPFGSRDRKMESYLLTEGDDREERIAYLFLEFKRQDLEIYKTIGMGMRVKKNSSMNTWYFVIDDNRRIGQDIDLYPRKLALTKTILKSIIGKQLIETQGEYRRRVNEALFGFETEQEYKEVLDLIIQLRSPKLSNSLKPTTLNDILNNALQPLSDDDLRPMTEAISSMDAIKDQVMILEENVKASKQIIQVYDQYNHRILLDKIESFLAVESETRKINKESQNMITQLKETKERKDEIEKINTKNDLEYQKLQDEKSSLLRDDIESLVHQMQAQKMEVNQISDDLTKKQGQLEDKERLQMSALNERKIKKDEVDQLETTIQKSFDDLEVFQEQLHFEEHIVLRSEFIENLAKPFNATYTNKRIENETKLINLGLDKFKDLYKLETQYASHLGILEEASLEKENLERNLEKEVRNMNHLIDDKIVDFYNWNQENQHLKLDIASMEDIAFEIKNLDTKDTSVQLKEVINKAYLKLNTTYIKEEEKHTHAIGVLREQKKEATFELNSWKEMGDPKLPLDESTEKNREILSTLNIPHASLYEYLEFEENLNESLRGEVEEKLQRTNLLGAQIIKQDHLDTLISQNHKTSDYYLVTEKNLDELTSFVISSDFVAKNNWAELFEHLGIKDATFNNINNHIVFNHLYSVITTSKSPRFIGKKARALYKEMQIQKLTLELATFEEAIKEQLNSLQFLEARKNILLEEYNQTPNFEKITEKRNHIQLLQASLYEKISYIEAKRKHLQVILDKTNEDRVYISELSNKLGIPNHEKSFTLRKVNLQSYKETFNEMIKDHKLYLKDLEIFRMINQELENLNDDIASFRDEISLGHRKVERLNSSIHNIQMQLDKIGYQNIKNRLEEIQVRLIVIENSEKANLEELGKLKNMIVGLEEKLIELKTRFEEQTKLYYETQSIYQQELDLAYVTDETSPKAIVNLIKQAYPELKLAKELGFDLQDVIHINRASLQEYNLKRYHIFEGNEDVVRLEISARYAGENINIKKLHDNLFTAINEQKILLEEKDRELIEEILINTISKKIRNKIQQSNEWVQRINRYMNDMNTSSGLKLSLNWQSKKGETQDELNSEKLVQLMQRDVKMLKEEDAKALSKHFESKINLARKKADLEETQESFHQIMRDIMDFRTWFTFKIMVQKQGEKKRELTNNAFNTFSGGEKAMSMYIPLFSALAAKYEGAKEDAPNIIALDEAFAGVDENNIENMFDLIRKFKFDYIMNSQVLWGDYESVKALSIYELFRPDNANFITIVGYDWNGKTKRLVTT